ncbi:MAG: hypothetical protein Q8L69_14640, partial [Gallionellaceae bacterium]|nr:hypothetical protein [Gallionellaceae bacterium]
MNLNKKVTFSSLTLAGVMITVLIAVSLLSFRQFSILSAKSQVRTAAEIIRVSLTEDMVNGVITQREGLFRRLSEVPGLKSVHVVRGSNVERQYGKGFAGEHVVDEAENKVLQNGEPYFTIIDEPANPVFRGTIPFVATRSGNPVCMQCHDVAEGAVLGAVTVTMSIEHMKQDALIVSGIMVASVAVFMLLMLFIFRRLVKPLITTAKDVQDAVSNAIRGDFHANIQRRTNDEIGQVAHDVNKLMQFLHKGLSDIRQDVALLLR